MNFTDLVNVFPALLDTGRSYELISAPGRGKSQTIGEQVERETKRKGSTCGFSTLFLATQTPSDLLGYMVPGIDERGRKRSEFTAPPWMYTNEGGRVEDYSHGILFLDEYGQGDADVKRASAELLLNRKLGPWSLPSGWSVLAASNRASDRSGVSKSFDFVINRRGEIHITDHMPSWVEWAVSHNVDGMIVAFAEQNVNIVFSEGVPAMQGPWCTPRSLVEAGKVIEALRKPGEPIPTDTTTLELVSGWIGDSAASQLFATIRLANEMPKYEEIVANPGATRIPEQPDALMLVAYTLASQVKLEHTAQIVQYIERFDDEFIALWVKNAAKYNTAIIREAAFRAMFMRHASLLNSVISSIAR